METQIVQIDKAVQLAQQQLSIIKHQVEGLKLLIQQHNPPVRHGGLFGQRVPNDSNLDDFKDNIQHRTRQLLEASQQQLQQSLDMFYAQTKIIKDHVGRITPSSSSQPDFSKRVIPPPTPSPPLFSPTSSLFGHNSKTTGA